MSALKTMPAAFLVTNDDVLYPMQEALDAIVCLGDVLAGAVDRGGLEDGSCVYLGEALRRTGELVKRALTRITALRAEVLVPLEGATLEDACGLLDARKANEPMGDDADALGGVE